MISEPMNKENNQEIYTSFPSNDLAGRVAQNTSLRAYIINPSTLPLFSFSNLLLDDYKFAPPVLFINLYSNG